MAFKRRGSDGEVNFPSVPSGKFLKDDGTWAIVTSDASIENVPIINHTGAAISSNWAYHHSKNNYDEKHLTNDQILSLHDSVTISGTGLTLSGQELSIDYSAVSAVHSHVWGNITGNIVDQSDLKIILDGKLSVPAFSGHANESLIVNQGEDGITFASVCILNEQGLIDDNYLPPSIVGAVVYQGVFNPANGEPSPKAKGYYYVANESGEISGTNFYIGDWLVYRDNTLWDRIPYSNVSITWDNLVDLPSEFIPIIHGNEKHTEDYITIDALNDYATVGMLDNLVSDEDIKDFITLNDVPTGISTFTGLIDTPSDYSNNGGKFACVKSTEDGIEFVEFPTSIDIDLENYVQKTGYTDGKYYVLKNDAWTVMPSGGGSGDSLYKELIYSIEGELYKTVFMYYRVPANSTLISATATVLNKPSGDNIEVDIRKNGVESIDSIFTNYTPITISPSATVTNGVYISSGTINESSVIENDILYVMVTNVGSTFKGTDLLVQIIMG